MIILFTILLLTKTPPNFLSLLIIYIIIYYNYIFRHTKNENNRPFLSEQLWIVILPRHDKFQKGTSRSFSMTAINIDINPKPPPPSPPHSKLELISIEKNSIHTSIKKLPIRVKINNAQEGYNSAQFELIVLFKDMPIN